MSSAVFENSSEKDQTVARKDIVMHLVINCEEVIVDEFDESNVEKAEDNQNDSFKVVKEDF